jgi:hypothetical protein
MDTTDWDEIDYFEYASEIQESINMFDKLEVSMVYVLEDDAIQKFGIEMNIEMNQDGAMIKVSGQIVVDINVELPKFPSDLDEYEALEVPLFGF